MLEIIIAPIAGTGSAQLGMHTKSLALGSEYVNNYHTVNAFRSSVAESMDTQAYPVVISNHMPLDRGTDSR
jgi:hypothetical protein